MNLNLASGQSNASSKVNTNSVIIIAVGSIFGLYLLSGIAICLFYSSRFRQLPVKTRNENDIKMNEKIDTSDMMPETQFSVDPSTRTALKAYNTRLTIDRQSSSSSISK